MAAITTAAAGNASATSTWTGGVVPGTTFAAIQRTTNASGYAVGATAITFDNVGAQPITAGKWFKVNGHTNYHKAASTLAASTAGTVTLAEPLTEAIPAAATAVSVDLVADKVTVNHEITYDLPFAVWGDDTSTGVTIASAKKLSVATTLSTKLVCRGQLVINGGYTGLTEAAPLSASYTHDLVLNDSASMASGKYGITIGSAATDFRLAGAQKTNVTEISATNTSLNFFVTSATGWTPGNVLFFGPTTHGISTVEVRAISAVNTGTGEVTLSAGVTNTNFVGRTVCNVSSNVRMSLQQAAIFAGSISVTFAATTATDAIELCDVEIVGRAHTASLPGAFALTSATPLQTKTFKRVAIHDVVSVSGSTVTTVATPVAVGSTLCLVLSNRLPDYATDILLCTKSGQCGVSAGSNASSHILRPVIVGASAPFGPTGNIASNHLIDIVEPKVVGATQVFKGLISGGLSVFGGSIDGYTQIQDGNVGTTSRNTTFTGVDMDGLVGVGSPTSLALVGAATGITLTNCDIPASAGFARGSQVFNTASEFWRFEFVNKDNDATAQQAMTIAGPLDRDNTANAYGTSSMRVDCWYPANAHKHSFTIPVAAGQTINLRGAMQVSENYASVTPTAPTVTISGLGITPVVATGPTSYSATPTAYSISATNPQGYPGEFTVTYSAQSGYNNSTAYAWFYGVIDAPWVVSTRLFGYLYDSNAYKTPDPSITLSAAAAAALPVSVNHGTEEITVSANVTAREVYEACMYDLTLSANQGADVHISSPDGTSFATSYEVILGPGGSISGRYSDVNGAVVSAAISNIVPGSQILIVRTDTAAVMANTTVAGSLYALNVQTASAIPISVRVRKASSAPYYQEWSTTGLIDPVGGFAATANQQPDQ